MLKKNKIINQKEISKRKISNQTNNCKQTEAEVVMSHPDFWQCIDKEDNNKKHNKIPSNLNKSQIELQKVHCYSVCSNIGKPHVVYCAISSILMLCPTVDLHYPNL